MAVKQIWGDEGYGAKVRISTLYGINTVEVFFKKDSLGVEIWLPIEDVGAKKRADAIRVLADDVVARVGVDAKKKGE